MKRIFQEDNEDLGGGRKDWGEASKLNFLDIDECTLNTDGCDHKCTNTFGSYTCSCRTGYRLDSSQHLCEGILLIKE